jgi:hypothetical protein
MNYIRKKLKDLIQIIVDATHGKLVDIVSIIGYSVVLVFVGMVCKIIFTTATSPKPIIPKTLSPTLYAILISSPMLIYYMSLAGDYLKKPSRRIQLFVFSFICTSIFAVGYVMQTANLGFVGWLNSIRNIEVIPSSLLVGNIRLITFIFPLGMIIPIASLIVQMIADRNMRKDIREHEIDLLLPTVNKMDDTTVDIKICEDIETGEDCIVPEKKTFEHTFLQGGTGSGKTATYIKPVLEQLFNKKAYLREKLKEIAYECLKEGIAVINQPVTNHWFNKNFTMELISPRQGKEKEFLQKFDRFIVGVRDKNELVYSDSNSGGVVELKHLEGDSKYVINIKVFKKGLEVAESTCELTRDITTKILSLGKNFKDITIQTYSPNGNNEDAQINNILNQGTIIEENQERIQINLPPLEDNLEYDIKVNEKGSGKIIYKGLGLCVVAPDGGLPSDTIKIANQFGVKVHKIDPTMAEIRKGGIAKFNPLKGGRADKVGDIISSILVSMDNAQGDNKSNPYFTNASVRAVRNLVILLKEMYPVMNNGADPTLRDVLDCLNNFNSVVPMVEAMKRDVAKRQKWGSVISYFETNFYPPPTDDRGRVITGGTIGSQRKKTEDSISGIINQLDNFVTREEVAYILCDRENSIDLHDIIENGECLAVSTRQNELGERLGKAFALFFILSMQNVVLSRYSEDENPEIPFHMIIDEFPFYINDNTKVFFTFARKYRCAVTIAIQNMAQLREISDVFRETIFTNTDTKMLLPKSNVEDRKYWSEFFGTYQSFEMQTGVNSSSIFSDNPKYSEQRRGTLQDVSNVSEQEINELNFKEALYCYTDRKGRTRVGKGLTDFMKIGKIPKMQKFDFEQFSPKEDFMASAKTKEKQKTTETNLQEELNEEEVLNIDLPSDIEKNSPYNTEVVEQDQNDTEENTNYDYEGIEKETETYEKERIKTTNNKQEDVSFEISSEVVDLSQIKTDILEGMELEDEEDITDENIIKENHVEEKTFKEETQEEQKKEQTKSQPVEISKNDMMNLDISQIDFSLEGE